MTKSRLFSTRYINGFTIVELLVVIVVIGILAAITIVLYSGITNRATIAALQSNLANASAILTLDQMASGDFPATLALANNGAGISSSQTLDGIIYVPDNISNPKNFCLEYRKGINTYAIEDESTPAKGVCLKNLITNGDFSNDTTGWSTSTAGITVTNGIATMLAFMQYGDMRQFPLPVLINNKYYIKADVKTTSNQVTLMVADYITFSTYIMSHTGSGDYETLSGIETISPNASVPDTFVLIRDNRASGWDNIYIKYFLAINLTATFGAGNEPTKDQMDTIMGNYPNSWFNIVAKANL